MRYQRVGLSVVALGVVGVVGLGGGSAQAQLTTYCDGVASDVTIPGDLVVPRGKSCDLTNVTVNGATTVRSDGNLLLTDSTLNSPLTVQSNAYAEALRSTVNGNVRLANAYGMASEASELRGNIGATNAVAGTSFVYSYDSRHQSVTSTRGEIYLESARVAGNVTSRSDELADLTDTVIEGRFTVTEAEAGSMVCASEIDGPVAIRGSNELIQFGGGSEPECAYSVLGSRLDLADNTALSMISGSVVRGELSCTGNDPIPAGANNRFRGTATGQCADLSSSATKSPASAATPDERKARILDRIEQRRSAGEKSAVQSGPAFG